MAKYCCFFHAISDYGEKTLDDICMVGGCNRKYGFPLYNSPKTIVNSESGVEYVVERPLSRGFYGATYLCSRKGKFFSSTTLLKVTPVLFYTEFSGKNFAKEVEIHNKVAKDADYLCSLRDAFEASVQFGVDIIECYVTELDYIDGVTLEEYISDDNNVTPRKLAQIAIDLLYMWDELIRKNIFHNDLHEGNLMVQKLSADERRVGAISPNIRLIAIDLGSAADESLSNYNRTGDQEFISRHIGKMASQLRSKYEDVSNVDDSDWRLVEILDQISEQLRTIRQNMDLPNIEDYSKQIRGQFDSAISYAPWAIDFSLSQFSEGINAQTIHSCNTPQLLVDPEGAWFKEIQIAGPQLIVGMRGCGKTMLLNALDIHARLEGENPAQDTAENKINRVKGDTFVAIKASCKSIIYNQALNNDSVLFETLFWKYAIEIIRAAKHLIYIKQSLVSHEYYLGIVKAFKAVFDVDIPADYCASDNDLEKYLYFESKKLYGAETNYRFCVQPEEAFEILASALIQCSDLFSDKKVFFLLDDASTRYLQENQIREMLKTLIFQSPSCAFKITTEQQTLDFGIKSPGNEEIADEFRDYTRFDLGAKVYEKTKSPRIGKQFIVDILDKRKKHYKGHPNYDPKQILGDVALSDIARTIRSNPGKSSSILKQVYYGLSALNALCVGDIGDTIKLYEMILDEYNNEPDTLPVSPKRQTHCFQILCSRRMYNLENRNVAYQKYALSFAEASHELLVKSSEGRLRQYTSLYVRITPDIDRTQQSKKLRDLIDAGIFVFADSGTPRTKTRDTNPMLQFKLVYRKLFGLSSYIGLSNRDRFELSGDDLANWLENPTKEALLKHAAENTVSLDDISSSSNDIYGFDEDYSEDNYSIQLNLIDINPSIYQIEENMQTSIEPSKLEPRKCRLRVVQLDSIPKLENNKESVIIGGLGFEDCCISSFERMFSKNKDVNEILLVSYNEQGHSTDIHHLIKKNTKAKISELACEDLESIRNFIMQRKDKRFIIDITSLTKPVIFVIMRALLLSKIDYVIVLTKALQYFPLEEDIQNMFSSISDDENVGEFNKLMSKLYVGETGPYNYLPLLELSREISPRPTALIGVLPAQNQRLLSFLGNKEYQSIAMMCLDNATFSSKLASMAAQIAQTNYDNTFFVNTDLDNHELFADHLQTMYYNLYSIGNMDVDLAITGTKMNAVICAAFTTINRINQCWYVQPKNYDTEHFSKGVGDTEYYQIKLTDHEGKN